MYAYQWTVKAKRRVGKIPAGAWVEIIKTNTSMKPTMLDIYKAFESKYGVKIPSVSEQNFDILKNF